MSWGIELFIEDTVLNCKSLALPTYVVEVILLRVAVLYEGMPNSIPDTWLAPSVADSILKSSLLGCLICSFLTGSVTPIPTFPKE